MSDNIPRRVSVRAYFHVQAPGENAAGNAEVKAIGESPTLVLPGAVFEGIVGVHHLSDVNYVRFDLPGLYTSADEADDAASAVFRRIVAAKKAST